MKRLIFSLCCLAMGRPLDAAWQLTWSDEFNAAANSKPDAAKWAYDLGASGWGNNELECYTDRTENVRHDGQGNLVIEARKERMRDTAGRSGEYTSGRLLTKGKFTQAYGRFEARIQLPVGKGYWPAFWMLGENIGKTPWPACGEIDIMENVGHEAESVHGTLHGPGYAGGSAIGSAYKFPGGSKISAFHVYALEWEPLEIRWYVDGKLYQTRKPADLRGKRWVYDHPFFIILNLAVGGAWPGKPIPSTRFPQSMLVDYVRVYRDPALKAPPAGAAEAASAQGAPAPFSGVKPVTLPGRIEAENFSLGGEGKGYHDLEPANQGAAYRLDEGVDVQECEDEGFGMNLGWTKLGEWTEYDVVSPGGRFVAKARVASQGKGGRFGLAWNGKDLSLAMDVNDSQGWQNWTSAWSAAFELPKGPGRLRITVLAEGEQTQTAGNLNYIEIVKAP